MRFLFRTVFRLVRLLLIPMLMVIDVAHTHEWVSTTVALLALLWLYTLLRMVGDFKKTFRGW